MYRNAALTFFTLCIFPDHGIEVGVGGFLHLLGLDAVIQRGPAIFLTESIGGNGGKAIFIHINALLRRVLPFSLLVLLVFGWPRYDIPADLAAINKRLKVAMAVMLIMISSSQLGRVSDDRQVAQMWWLGDSKV